MALSWPRSSWPHFCFELAYVGEPAKEAKEARLACYHSAEELYWMNWWRRWEWRALPALCRWVQTARLELLQVKHSGLCDLQEVSSTHD